MLFLPPVQRSVNRRWSTVFCTTGGFDWKRTTWVGSPWIHPDQYKHLKIDVDQRNNYGFTPLLLAAFCGRYDLVLCLLTRTEASPFVRDDRRSKNLLDYIDMDMKHKDLFHRSSSKKYFPFSSSFVEHLLFFFAGLHPLVSSFNCIRAFLFHHAIQPGPLNISSIEISSKSFFYRRWTIDRA